MFVDLIIKTIPRLGLGFLKENQRDKSELLDWAYDTAGEHFWKGVPKLSILSAEILSRAHGNFEQQKGVLEF
jgi:hypothetical protein